METDENDFVESAEGLEYLSGLGCRLFNQKDAGWITRSARTKGPVDLFSVIDEVEEFRELLVNVLSEFRSMLEKASGAIASAHSIGLVRTREVEMRWLEDNKDLLAELAGKWIVVDGNRLVAADEDFSNAARAARAEGITTPFILFIPEPTSGPTIGV